MPLAGVFGLTTLRALPPLKVGWACSVVQKLLHRNRAAHRRSMHQTALRQVVILYGAVLHRAVVPHQEVAGPPRVTVDEGRLYDVIRERRDKGRGFVRLHPLDAGTVGPHDVQAFASGTW